MPERAKKAFPEKWSVKGGRELVNFLDDCKSQGMYKLKNYAGNAQLYYNFDGQELSDYGNKKFEKVTVDQLREHYLNTKQNMEEESKKEIIGYKCPMDLYGGEVKLGTSFLATSSHPTSRPMFVAVDAHKKIINSGFYLPKEIVETWKPVYKEEEVKLSIGNPAREIVVNKDGVWYGDTLFKKEELDRILSLFNCQGIRNTELNVHIKKIWVGCESQGTEVTKSEILKVIKTAEKL